MTFAWKCRARGACGALAEPSERLKLRNAYGKLRAMKFEVLGDIGRIETIATGHGIHILARLIRRYGRGNWRKLKGFATVRLEDGTIAEAELHWFEAHGIGKRKMKIKHLIDRYE